MKELDKNSKGYLGKYLNNFIQLLIIHILDIAIFIINYDDFDFFFTNTTIHY